MVNTYGMGECNTFLDIAPMVHWPDGSTCLNPDFNAITKFHRSALAIDPNNPTRGLQPAVVLGPGDVANFQLTVDREENGMGHFLINELLMLTNPEGSRGLRIVIKDQQGDRTYMNEGVFNTLLFGTGQLNCCLPCPIMLWPNQTLVFQVINDELVDVRVRIVARGKRFMPYHNMGLVAEMEDCWARIPSMPFWLTLDNTQVTVPAAVGNTPGVAQSQMTVPGGGWFELVWPRCEVIVGADLDDGADITVAVTEGRIGRQAQNIPINLPFYATPTLSVAGFPGDLFRAAVACHCPPPRQVYRANMRIIHNFQNFGVVDTVVRLTYAGCYHFVDRCPPQDDLDAARRGDDMLDPSQLILEPDWECLPPPIPDIPEERLYEKTGVSGPVIVDMFRQPELPYNLAYGLDDQGNVHVVVRNPKTDTFERIASPAETPSWAGQYANQMTQGLAGMNGMGKSPQGEWERI